MVRCLPVIAPYDTKCVSPSPLEGEGRGEGAAHRVGRNKRSALRRCAHPARCLAVIALYNTKCVSPSPLTGSAAHRVGRNKRSALRRCAHPARCLSVIAPYNIKCVSPSPLVGEGSGEGAASTSPTKIPHPVGCALRTVHRRHACAVRTQQTKPNWFTPPRGKGPV